MRQYTGTGSLRQRHVHVLTQNMSIKTSKTYYDMGQNDETKVEERPQVIQLIPPQETRDEIARLEKQYRETVERENR